MYNHDNQAHSENNKCDMIIMVKHYSQKDREEFRVRAPKEGDM